VRLQESSGGARWHLPQLMANNQLRHLTRRARLCGVKPIDVLKSVVVLTA
jgi:hypothetical protein